jgi:hypothetical protein
LAVPADGAQVASTPPVSRNVAPRERRAWRVLPRVGLGALLVTALVSFPQATEPAPAEASCATGWTSRKVPPPTIRVLRTATGNVETVAFRRYVAVVMASGEWPSRLPVAALEVGAVATKQYAWYHALKGNHRAGFRTASGECFDVRDDVRDQIYRPERAKPTAKQRRAVDRTWGLSLRKRGRFFMTGYRAGSTGRCAADADGWRLYTRSVRDCAARLGWNREQIQRVYYAPGYSEVWAASIAGPVVSAPDARLAASGAFPGQAATVTWAPITNASKMARYQLQRRVRGGAWRKVGLGDPGARSTRVALRAGAEQQFRVRAVNRAGRKGPWATSQWLDARLRHPDATRLVGSGWRETPEAEAIGGTLTVAHRADDRLVLRFKGRSVAYVASVGPDLGRARIRVNGKAVAVVDLSAPTDEVRQVVWARNWRRSDRRKVTIEVVDPGAPVPVDAFLLLR